LGLKLKASLEPRLWLPKIPAARSGASTKCVLQALHAFCLPDGVEQGLELRLEVRCVRDSGLAGSRSE
jgi:hypothetical protein